MLLQASHYYNIVLVVHIGAKHWNLFKIQIHFFKTLYKSTNTSSARIYLSKKNPNKKFGNFGIDSKVVPEGWAVIVSRLTLLL